MDGVLVDSGELHYQSWIETLSAEGIPFSPEAFRLTFGMNNTSILALLLGRPPEPETLQRISDHKESLFRSKVRGRVEPLPGVHTWLERLAANGYRQAVASSGPLANVEVLVDEMRLRPYFTALVSAFDLPGKPDPAVFLEAARRLEAEPQNCVVVEDGIPGVEAARRAGMACIAVTTTNPAHDLAGADLIVAGLTQLAPDAFNRLLAKASI